MKHCLFLLPALGLLSFFSCSKELETSPEINNHQAEAYTIPIETALSSLEAFMQERGMIPQTRGSGDELIDNYFTVSVPSTRASGAEENLLYAVNFKDEGGYALLAADSRIQEDILAITDNGSIAESDFDEPMIERIPTDNDDLSVEEYDRMVASGVLALEQSNIHHVIKSYASRQLETFHYGDVRMVGSPCDPSGPGGGKGGGGYSYTETFSWETVKEVPRMMNTAWTQSTEENDIFNKYCPEVGLIWRRKAPAGCVCIAVSQIMAFHEFPTSLTCNGMKIDYPEIKRIFNYDNNWYDDTDAGKEMLARFCLNVGGWCKTLYFSIFGEAYGFAWPSDAKSCLELFGYQNVSLNWGYDEDLVKAALDNGCPVFISAIADFLQGHAWVIDGYIQSDYVSDRGKVTKSQTLVHCNWGWQGLCNGYFTSGVFNTRKAQAYDFNIETNDHDNYWCGFNTITYENPNK